MLQKAAWTLVHTKNPIAACSFHCQRVWKCEAVWLGGGLGFYVRASAHKRSCLRCVGKHVVRRLFLQCLQFSGQRVVFCMCVCSYETLDLNTSMCALTGCVHFVSLRISVRCWQVARIVLVISLHYYLDP